MVTEARGLGPAPLRIERSDTGPGRVCLAMAGEVDLSNVERMRAVVTGILHEPGTAELLLDLDQLDFIDSLGVQAMIEARRLADTRQIRFFSINAQGKVLRVLTVLGVYTFLSSDAGRSN
jgi:stage II sporulation protein AA (anti-sigma F factor antagonist)